MQFVRPQFDKPYHEFGRQIEDEEIDSGMLHVSIEERPLRRLESEHVGSSSKAPDVWITPAKLPAQAQDPPARLAPTPRTRGTTGARKSLPVLLRAEPGLALLRASFYEKERITAELISEWRIERVPMGQTLEKPSLLPKLSKASSSPGQPT